MALNFDRWLTTDPRGEIDTAFEVYCEKHDLDPSTDEALAAFEAWRESLED